MYVILYKYSLQEWVTWEIATPRKPMSTEAKPNTNTNISDLTVFRFRSNEKNIYTLYGKRLHIPTFLFIKTDLQRFELKHQSLGVY